MKPIAISRKSKTVTSLLKKARKKTVILQAPDGRLYMLAPMDWVGFDVGNGDFSEEVKRTVQNKALMKFLAKRKREEQGKGMTSEELREHLGL